MKDEVFNILLIEDNPGDARLIRMYLEEEELEHKYFVKTVQTLKDGERALRGKAFDIILLDLSLPDSSGFDTFYRLYGLYPGIPVVVLTGLKDEKLGVSAVKAGAQDFLNKGEINGPLLQRTLAYAVERKSVEKELKEERDFLTALLDTVGALVIVLDPSGTILRFNHTCEEVSGLNSEEVSDKKLWDLGLIPDNEIEEVKEQVFEKLKKGESQVSFENHWICKEGEKRLITWNNSFLRDDSGKVKFIIGTGIDITDRKKLETDLLNAVVEGQEGERRRLAKDLHDGLAPLLSSAKLNLEALNDNLDKIPGDKHKFFNNVKSLLDTAMGEARTMSHNLLPRGLEDFGLPAALKNLCDKVSDANQVRINFYNVGIHGRLEKAVELSLYRIAQELINNALRHSGAAEITVQLIRHVDSLLLMSEDDGKGFNPQRSRRRSGGFGLKNIESRVKSLNGKFHIDSSKEGGTLISVEIPFINK